MAEEFFQRVEAEIAESTMNLVNVKLLPEEKPHLATVRKRLREDYNYESTIKNFDDYLDGQYTVLTINIDGTDTLVLQDTGPTIRGGMIGSLGSLGAGGS